ncbi:MAG: hypothetical protein KDB72_19630 [Mycobacterium sp.]|nr:hypothetical protein [Mycobacterium sp.]
MVKISTMGLAALGVSAAVMTAPAALADPADAAAPADPGTSVQAAPANAVPVGDVVAAPPTEVPHLTSPQNLPPGTTDNPDQQSHGLGYLRDLLHAIRTQDVKPSDALLLLAQRPMNSNTTPPGMSSTPTGPVGSSSAVPAPAPAADPAAPTP